MEATPSSTPQPAQLAHEIATQFQLTSLPQGFRHHVLRELVGQSWGPLPPYSTLTKPEISEVARATVGTGVVPVFRHPSTHEWCALVVRPGTHYQGPRYAADPDQPYFMMAGGFINLSSVPSAPGSSNQHSSRAEHPTEGAVRELREEVVDDKGAAVLSLDPKRLCPIDTLTLSFPSGEKRIVIGFTSILDPCAARRVLDHVERVSNDGDYRRACRANTVNKETGKPEVCRVDVLPLRSLLSAEIKLLHPDQRSFFEKLSDYLERAA